MPPDHTERERPSSADRALREKDDPARPSDPTARTIEGWWQHTSEAALTAAAKELGRGPALFHLESREREALNKPVRYRTRMRHRESAEGGKETCEVKLSVVHRCDTTLDDAARATLRLRRRTDA